MTTRVGITKATARIASLCAVFVLAACGGGKKDEPGPNPPNPPTNPTYTVSGTVSGLTGAGLVLRNNGANNLAVSSNGAFQFTTALANGAAYAVTVMTQPASPTQTCTITNGSGAIASANVTNVAVTCVGTTFTVGGSVTGLNGTGLVLQNNGGDNLAINTNGAFVFNSAQNNGSAYTVSVLTQPAAPIQQCVVTNGSGTNASGNVSNVAIACTDVVPRLVFAMNGAAGTLSTFRVEASTGELRAAGYTKVGTNPIGFGVANSPSDPTLGFFYTLNQGSANITGANYSRITGAGVSAITGSPFALPSAPNSFRVHPSQRFIYAVHPTAGNISVFAIDGSTGALTAVAGSPFAAGGTPISVVFDPTGQFAYVVNQASANIYTYAVNTTTGVLTELVANRIATGTTPRPMTMHPSGRVAFVANGGSANISAYTIDTTTGALANAVGSPFATGVNPAALGLHPSGLFGYIVHNGPNNVSGYAINSTTGVLTTLGGSPYPTGVAPVGFIFDVTSKFMYVSNFDAANPSISIFGVNLSSGVLTAVGSPVSTLTSPRLTTEGSGKYLYAVSNSTSLISSYSINQTTGALTPLANMPQIASGTGPAFLFPALSSPTPVTVIPKYAYLANDGGASNGNVVSYSINANTGALTSLGTSIATGVAPSGMATTANGKYVYVANYDSNTLSAYVSNNGVLTAVAGSPFATPAAPHFVSIDGGGRFVYVAHDSTISAYAINADTGALSPISGPIAAGNFPESLAVDDSGRCLYAANNGSNTVSAYTINSLTGALTAVGGSPFATGSFPVDIKIHPSGRFVYVTNDGNNTVSAYSITTGISNTCVLTAIAGSPTSAGPAAFGLVSIATEPNGKFVYAANEATGAISTFSVNQSTGALSLIGTPAAIGGTGVTADPSGKYLYVVIKSGMTDSLVTYNINPTTGALSPTVGTPVNVTNATAGAITGELQL